MKNNNERNACIANSGTYTPLITFHIFLFFRMRLALFIFGFVAASTLAAEGVFSKGSLKCHDILAVKVILLLIILII